MKTIHDIEELKNSTVSGTMAPVIEDGEFKGNFAPLSRYEFFFENLVNNAISKLDGEARNEAIISEYDQEARNFIQSEIERRIDLLI